MLPAPQGPEWVALAARQRVVLENICALKARVLLAAHGAGLVSAPAREAFSKKVLGRSTTAVLAYWNQMVFSGRNVPPATRPSEADVVAFVRSTPGAIGYVSESTPASGVAVVTMPGPVHAPLA